MEVATTSDIYCPSVLEGAYVDFIPPIDAMAGIKCPCNGCARAYKSKQAFRTHTTSRSHVRWLANLNANRDNHYIELVKARENERNQRLIIARLTQQISELSSCLAAVHRSEREMNRRPATESIDLISFD